jgi:hypothetical protein
VHNETSNASLGDQQENRREAARSRPRATELGTWFRFATS